MIKMTPAKVGVLVFAIALTFYWSLLNTTGPGWIGWYRLASAGQTAVATVTDIQPENHQSCSFKFSVDGVEHKSGSSGCSTLGIGGQLPVIYLPSEPEIVSTGDPTDELLFDVFGPLGLAVLAGIVSAWRFRQSKRA